MIDMPASPFPKPDVSKYKRLPPHPRLGISSFGLVELRCSNGQYAGPVILRSNSELIHAGDILVALDGYHVKGTGDIARVLAKSRPADKIEVDVFRAVGVIRKLVTVTIELGAWTEGGPETTP